MRATIDHLVFTTKQLVFLINSKIMHKLRKLLDIVQISEFWVTGLDARGALYICAPHHLGVLCLIVNWAFIRKDNRN